MTDLQVAIVLQAANPLVKTLIRGTLLAAVKKTKDSPELAMSLQKHCGLLVFHGNIYTSIKVS